MRSSAVHLEMRELQSSHSSFKLVSRRGQSYHSHRSSAESRDGPAINSARNHPGIHSDLVELAQKIAEEDSPIDTDRELLPRNSMQQIPTPVDSCVSPRLSEYGPRGSDSEFDHCFEQLYDVFYGRDTNVWTEQVNETNFLQSRCQPPGLEVVQVKITTSIAVPMEVLIDNAIDFDIRQRWDEVLYDFRTFYMAKDRSYSRVSYAFKSPFPVSDRDFYLRQLVRYNSPEPGMCTMHI